MLAAVLVAVVLQDPSLAPARAAVGSAGSPGVVTDSATLARGHSRPASLARTVRVTGDSPRLDGRLDDPAWAQAEPITDFRQNLPQDGEPATERTEARIVYDGDAIYVGVRMDDRDAAGIRRGLGRRDSYLNADWVLVGFDSFHDHRTAFQFVVNASGVKADEMGVNDQGPHERSWDPVWDVAVAHDADGWTAEFRIPFSQLRYPGDPEQVWGVRVRRWIERKAEGAEFGWAGRTERGHASYFAHLVGLRDLPQPRRLEVLPYTTVRESRVPVSRAGDPFNDGSVQAVAGGVDLKYGLTSNLTLDVTVNPDFGQVEQDPAIVNLSAFESFFPERRPFFIEGAGIFGFGRNTGQQGGTSFFYSRRIGRTPQAAASARGGFVDTPDNATILGAAKLSGRTRGGWSVGLLNALTAREEAVVVAGDGTRFRDVVEPLTNYTVGRVRRDLRGGASNVGVIATAVRRDLDDDRLLGLRSAAYSGGLDFSHRMFGNRYGLSGSVGWSRIEGDPQAIQRAQLSSARYFQRPDADHVEFDPDRTSLSGWNSALAFAKETGNLVYTVSSAATSPGFELNDLGFQTGADILSLAAAATRRWTRPGRVFRQANLGVSLGGDWNFGGDRTASRAGINWFAQFLNYWSVNGNLNGNLAAANTGLTRGGPLGRTPPAWNAFLGVNSDFRKPVQAFLGVNYFANTIGARGGGVYTSLTLRPSSAVQFSTGPSLNWNRTSQQYVQAESDPTATATFGRRYLFSDIDQATLDFATRLNVTVSPTLSLELFAQPFVSSGDYTRFKEFRTPGAADYLVFGEDGGSTLVAEGPAGGPPTRYLADPDGPGPRPASAIANPDFAVTSLRGNAVIRWEYRPGSTLFFVWTRNCSGFDSDPAFEPGRSLGNLCQGAPASNIFAIKANYWLSL